MNLRPMVNADVDAVVAIEMQFSTSLWSAARFEHELTLAWSRLLVAESDGGLAGYAISWVTSPEAELHSIVVHGTHRRRGVASQLLAAQLERLQREGVTTWQLEVRASNLSAQALYTKHGFRPVGTRRAYYQDGEDALLMTLVM